MAAPNSQWLELWSSVARKFVNEGFTKEQEERHTEIFIGTIIPIEHQERFRQWFSAIRSQREGTLGSDTGTELDKEVQDVDINRMNGAMASFRTSFGEMQAAEIRMVECMAEMQNIQKGLARTLKEMETAAQDLGSKMKKESLPNAGAQ